MGRKTICCAKLPVDARYFARGGVGDAELDDIGQEFELGVGGLSLYDKIR